MCVSHILIEIHEVAAKRNLLSPCQISKIQFPKISNFKNSVPTVGGGFQYYLLEKYICHETFQETDLRNINSRQVISTSYSSKLLVKICTNAV